MSLEFLCKSCGRSFKRYNTLQRKCGLCSYNTQTKPRKPLKHVGKVTKQWISTRQAWIAQNSPQDGLYTCYYCKTKLTVDEMELDHKLSRSRRPDLRFDLSNLVPSCHKDNSSKGSLSAEEYMKTL